MTTCRIIQVAAAAPDERYMTTCRIIQVAAVRPEREIHDNESMYPRCGDGPVREIYDDESKYSRCGCGPVREIYDDESRYPRCGGAPIYDSLRRYPVAQMSLSFPGATQMCSIVRRSNLTPYVKMGRANHIFFSSVAKQAHNFIRGAGSSPEEA
ncbi:hypothetical protein TcYC6_0010610 [Trypanosoma cruzi]|nr:hypothetical protein TcYC6_0010610 [Trypanosoma cruzi]